MTASLINFCTNDFRFLKQSIDECKKFSDQILISVCDHFFDGTPENYSLLEQIYASFPAVQFIEYPYDPEFAVEDLDRVHFWHNKGRLLAFYFLKEAIDYVFFWDVDEIPDGDQFAEWLNIFPYRDYSALRFSSYWYFREMKYRALAFPDTALMAKRSCLHPDLFLDPDERAGMFYHVPGEKRRWMRGLDGKPMLHHYSWVRSKTEMLKKTKSWGHHWERDWQKLVEEEFSREFNGKDFIRFFEFEELTPHFPNVAKLTEQEIFKLDLKKRFDI